MTGLRYAYQFAKAVWTWICRWRIGLALSTIGVTVALWSGIPQGILAWRDVLNSETDPVSQPAAVAASFSKCTPLALEDDWEKDLYGSLLRENGRWYLASTSRRGGLLRTKKPVLLDKDITFTFIPYSEKEMNVVFVAHNLYELTLGNGGYDGITVATFASNGQPPEIIEDTLGNRRNIFENGDMGLGKPVTVDIRQGVSRQRDGKYKLDLNIARTSSNTISDQVYATYSFPLPPTFSFVGDSTNLSLGLINSSDDSEVAAEFVCFDVE